MYKLTWILAFVVATFADKRLLIFTDISEKYHISKVQMEYSQAYATCKRYGWTLATEETAEETKAVNNAITAEYIDEPFWIGGFRQVGAEFDLWIWLEQGRAFNYTNWYGSNINIRDCLCRRGMSSYGGKWNPYGCASELYFICKEV